MTQGFTIQGDGFIRVQALLNDLNSRMASATLDVGWDNRTKYPDGTYVANVARIQEFGGVINHPGGTRYIKDAVISRRRQLLLGTRFVGPDFKGDAQQTAAHTIKIPARPFIRPAISANGARWSNLVWNDLKTTDMPVDAILERVGLVVVSDIQKSIQAVTSPPLKAATIRARKQRGFENHLTVAKPLIDSGLMLKSLRAKVTITAQDETPATVPTSTPKTGRGIVRRALRFVKKVFAR